MNRQTSIAAGLLLLALVIQAQAQTPASPCPGAQTPGLRVESATSPGAATALPTGTPVAASLQAVDRIFFAVPAGDRPIARTYGGTFALDLAQTGAWRVAVDAQAHIDLVQGGKRIAPRDTGAVTGGCFVQQARYDLKPGHYLLQLSASQIPVLSLLVERTQK